MFCPFLTGQFLQFFVIGASAHTHYRQVRIGISTNGFKGSRIVG
jgi:hypothetical protein